LPSGYLDLRNLQLNKNKQPFIAKSNKYLKCDFTNSNFIETNWIECEFDNCKFINIDFSKACLKATEIKNCIFEGCNFTAAIFSFRKCKKFGLFQETEFFNCNLTNIHVDLPLFKNCKFQDCIYKNTNFQGSRFEDCEFSGLMESGHFNGYANEDFYWGIWPFKINPKDYPNKMTNVDFSKAEIKDFAFVNNLDLSKVTFPDNKTSRPSSLW
jgi:hypothetical protein